MALLNYKGLNIFTVGLVGCENAVLMPGINEIEDNVMVKLKQHPNFNARVKNGLIQLIEDVKVDKEGKKSEGDLLAMIPRIFDGKLLRKIIKEDGRASVMEAAKNQLDIILGKKEEPKEQSGEHFK